MSVYNCALKSTIEAGLIASSISLKLKYLEADMFAVDSAAAVFVPGNAGRETIVRNGSRRQRRSQHLNSELHVGWQCRDVQRISFAAGHCAGYQPRLGNRKRW